MPQFGGTAVTVATAAIASRSALVASRVPTRSSSARSSHPLHVQVMKAWAELVARIVAAIVSALERRFPGIRFDASYDPSTSLFEPVALAVAVASDVAWMRERGVEAEIGDELAFRLIPADIEQATQR